MSARNVKIWAVIVLAAGLVIVFTTFSDYGITWDEPVQSHYGEGVLRYFNSGLTDNSVNEFLHMRFYGPLFELTAALAYAGAPESKYSIRHLLIGLTGLATVLAVLGLGAGMPGRWVPIFAPLVLVALPRFYGHAFNNSKDIPFACAVTFAVWTIWRLSIGCGSRNRARPAVLCGLALGAALAVRPGGLPVLLLLFATGLSWRLFGASDRGAGTLATVRALKETTIQTTIAWTIAWFVMVVLWPWAHANPFLNPIRAVAAAYSFPDTFPVLFEGAVTSSDALPRYYLVKYLAITTPLVTLVLTAVGLAVGARELLRPQRTPATLGALLVGVWLLAPLTFATVGRPNVYDGLRHLLFALPALALLAGLGASAAVTTLSRWLTRISASLRPPDTAMVAVMALVISLPWVEIVRLHPYQSSYFNILVGGLAGAGGRYEADYWLSSYREAMEWVNTRAAESGRPVTVLVAADVYSAECAGHFVGDGVTMVYSAESGITGEIPQQFDYYVSTTRYAMDHNFSESPVVHRIEREGTTLTLIRRRARSLPGL